MRINSSFRDPDGYMFEQNGEIYRAVSHSYKIPYDHLLSSGLGKKLIDQKLMVPFEEIDQATLGLLNLYKVIKPERIPFISYPYEWSFNMLKDAALLTLIIQKFALEHGMSLKDSSAFNIQFHNGKPIFIDTLSFEMLPENKPWFAYRQFCQHFLAPLALMTHIDPSLNRLFIIHIDGIPLQLAAKMLPFKCRFNLGLYLHIILHARSQKKYDKLTENVNFSERKFSLSALKSLLEGLRITVENLRWNPIGTEWADYTDEGVHPNEYTKFKTKTISEFLEISRPKIIWDLGANNGIFSRIAAHMGSCVISMDVDPACVEKNYTLVQNNNDTKLLPLLMDVLNPSPSIGWDSTERISLLNRQRPDLIMALAIIHHLAISANIPIELIADFFAQSTDNLIIEFIAKEDEKVQILLANRRDIFPDYSLTSFERIFSEHYKIQKISHCPGNTRVLYLMQKK